MRRLAKREQGIGSKYRFNN